MSDTEIIEEVIADFLKKEVCFCGPCEIINKDMHSLVPSDFLRQKLTLILEEGYRKGYIDGALKKESAI